MKGGRAISDIPAIAAFRRRAVFVPAVVSILLILSCGIAAGPDAGEAAEVERLDCELFRREIEDLLGRGEFSCATVAVKIVSLPTGEEIFSRRAKLSLIPASNIKLFTSAAALVELGRDYRFITRFYLTVEPDDSGLVGGNLIVKGGGDPNISGRFTGKSTALFDKVADDILASGVKRIAGDIILDDGMFDRQYVHPDWPRAEAQEWYCAGVSALSFNDNCVEVAVAAGEKGGEPAAVTITPENDYVVLINECVTTDKKKQHSFKVSRNPTGNNITVSGRFYTGAESYRTDIAVYRPPLFFGAVLMDSLARSGVAVDGRVRLAARVYDEEKDELIEAARLESPLLRTLRVANRRSQNFYAEQVFKTLGYAVEGKGSFRSGAGAVTEVLKNIGVEDPGIVVRDGGGLSRKNRLTANAVVDLLVAMYDEKYRGDFCGTLSVAGRNGSAASRLRQAPYAARLFVKTGTVRGASALSGYAKNLDGKWFAFAIIGNGFPAGGLEEIKGLEDEICRLIVRLEIGGGPGSRLPAPRRANKTISECEDVPDKRGEKRCSRR